MFSNIWKNPKTTIAGLLIGVSTIAGVLSQQGVTFGKAGNGTIIALISGIAAALLGLLSRDPAPPTATTNTTQKLGAWALIAVLLPVMLFPMCGCSAQTVAQDIVNWTPAMQSAVTVIDSTASMLLPADAPIFLVATGAFNGLSTLVASAAQTYLNNPNASTLAQLQAQVLNFQQNISVALLASVKILDPASQKLALAAINGIAIIIQSIIALIASIKGSTIVTQATTAQHAANAVIRRFWDEQQSEQIVAGHYRISQEEARLYIEYGELQLAGV